MGVIKKIYCKERDNSFPKPFISKDNSKMAKSLRGSLNGKILKALFKINIMGPLMKTKNLLGRESLRLNKEFIREDLKMV